MSAERLLKINRKKNNVDGLVRSRCNVKGITSNLWQEWAAEDGERYDEKSQMDLRSTI